MKSYCKGLAVDEMLLGEAYERWLDGGAGRRNRWRVRREHGSAEALIAEIAREVADGTLHFEPISTATRHDGGKDREIGIEPVKQQVCGYAVDVALEGLMRAKLGYWQFSRKGMGQFRAAPTVKRWMHGCRYHVHGDVRKCYDSISCEVVMRILRRYVRSPDVLRVAGAILDSYPDGHLMIGSFFSMRMAHLVLSFGYHRVEALHKARRGKRRALVAHQCWYVDDFWLFGDDRRDLKAAMRELSRYMRDELGVEIKPWKVCRCDVPPREVRGRSLPMAEPADIAGPVVDRGRVTIRAETFLKARRCLLRYRRKPWSDRLARRLISYWGWLKNTDCRRFCRENGVYAAVASAKRLVGDMDRGRARCHSRQSFATASPRG